MLSINVIKRIGRVVSLSKIVSDTRLLKKIVI
jgi:hypothetical protein